MPSAGEVSFELERFEWTADGQLVVMGRWHGVSGRRVGRPALTVEAGGRRHRVTGEANGTDSEAPWRAVFAWDAERGEVAGAELEIGRSLVVELPPPRRRRRRPATVGAEEQLRTQVLELEAEVSALRAELAATPPAVAAGDELAGLRLAHGSLRAAHESLEDELEGVRAGARQDRAELAAARARAEDAERDLAETRGSLERVSGELDAARADAEQRLEGERATTTEAHARLATAHEETQRTILAEAAETERLMVERVSRDLERERAATRVLRRELEALQTGTAEHRRAVSSATANGTLGAGDALPRTVRTAEGTQRRVEAARVASSQRVPRVGPSPVAQWAVRGVAALLIALMGIALVFLVTLVL